MSPAVAASTDSVRHPNHRFISSNDCLPSNTGTLRTTFPCPICYKTFSYPKDLRRHAITHEKTPQRPFQCPISDCEYGTKGFSRRDVLIRHAKGVHGLQGI
ncbi:hypothetical protein AC578_2803 [Pseudocercospora eumusae]|uniref:C2H2-type domain-containing protein n=1 Tax=Pseudocercospora eumusae TaxID=321146 RepID=A0A139HGV8_9PEZI|nr:hypothetical protein AC578_2803 [Pseudocercospora eumusae]